MGAGGAADVRGVGWGRCSILLTLCGGPPLALLSYAGFILVPLGHGGVIQPSCAALGGLLLSTLVVKEKLPRTRLFGAIAIVCGLCVIGYEALSTIGVHGILGDLCFMAAGFTFATFGMLLKLWRVSPIRSVAITSVLSLALIPVEYYFGFDRLIAAGRLYENVIGSPSCRSVFAGAGATFLFTRAVVLLGAGEGGGVSGAGAAVHVAVTGLIWCWNRADGVAACRHADRAVRIPADAEGVSGYSVTAIRPRGDAAVVFRLRTLRPLTVRSVNRRLWQCHARCIAGL